jgi:hypothetical protein
MMTLQVCINKWQDFELKQRYFYLEHLIDLDRQVRRQGVRRMLNLPKVLNLQDVDRKSKLSS